ncbi:OLC1v1006775C1 [Oldenlandia corymbosa var. corymbosa]|uniref:OLC1v1006775C1 n=1 Tax=Oldenlandia corymbosa var. corymbosa TaxID=529605 RepID=A0AAV1DHT4_OLDCO|nr:OLC1v1006775C1 [Oldenlandia corymbosa var. corymbosa]
MDVAAEVSNCTWAGVNQKKDVSITPIKDCWNFSYFENNCDYLQGIEELKEPSPQVKRCGVLQFNSNGLDTLSVGEMSHAGAGSKDRVHLVEDNLSELSNWTSGYGEGTLSASRYGSLDQSSEVWVASLFSDGDTQISPIDEVSSNEVSEAECSNQPSVSAVSHRRCSVKTHRNGLKGKNSYMKTPVNLASSVAYPFTIVKPCAIHGDMTLEDINKRIRNPRRPLKHINDGPAPFPTSAFSGKPVVGTTMIRTEGGKGTITVLRTRG